MKCPCEEMAGNDLDVSAQCIGNLWLFRNLDPEDIRALVGAAQRRIYEVGEPIFHQGEQAKHMFPLKAGRVKLSKVNEDGSELILDIRKAGDFIGEQMLSEETEYPVSALCIEKTMICGFTKARFENLLKERPGIGIQVIRNLSSTIHWLTDHAGSLSFSNLEERLYQVLVTVAREHGTPAATGYILHFPLTHEDLSFLVGAHRVSITRAMKHLRDQGRVVADGRSLVVAIDENAD